MSDLIERLLTDAAYCRTRIGATVKQIGRDCDEAATALSEAKAENERLREALTECGAEYSVGRGVLVMEAAAMLSREFIRRQLLARAALNPKGGDNGEA